MRQSRREPPGGQPCSTWTAGVQPARERVCCLKPRRLREFATTAPGTKDSWALRTRGPEIRRVSHPREEKRTLGPRGAGRGGLRAVSRGRRAASEVLEMGPAPAEGRLYIKRYNFLKCQNCHSTTLMGSKNLAKCYFYHTYYLNIFCLLILRQTNENFKWQMS